MSNPSIRERALRGSAWTLGGFGTARVLRLGNHLILAWLLTPEIFGLMALVKVFMQALEMFSDIGIGPSIIQNERGRDPTFLNTAWTIQILRGLSLWIIACAFAWPVAWWYAQNDPAAWKLTALLPVAAFTAVLHGFNSPALFLLKKELRLGRVTMIQLLGQIASLSVMVVWALIDASVWAMVAGGLAAAGFRLVASHFVIPGYRVRLQWDHECMKALVTFGKWIFLSTAFTYLATNLDKVILGRLLTLAELGLYGIAMVFAKVALDVASRLGITVMFPVYSKFKNDPARLMRVALKSRDVVLWIGGAASIAIAVGSPLFFETFWDPRYHYAGIIAQWLAINIWVRILLQTMDRIPLSVGNSKALFVSNVIKTAGMAVASLGYWAAGLPGFIVGLAVGPLAAHIYLVFFLPSHRREMLVQSASFTGVVVAVGAGLVGITWWIRVHAGPGLWAGSTVAGVVLPLAAASWVAYHRIWGNRESRGPSVPVVGPSRIP